MGWTPAFLFISRARSMARDSGINGNRTAPAVSIASATPFLLFLLTTYATPPPREQEISPVSVGKGLPTGEMGVMLEEKWRGKSRVQMVEPTGAAAAGCVRGGTT